MSSRSPLILLVSKTESLQNGLLALITTLPQIGAVLVAEDNDVALRMIKNHDPSFVILDTALPNSHEMIKQLKDDWESVHLIVLVEDTAQQKVIEALGVDSVLIEGFSPEKLLTVVENLIEPQRGSPPHQIDKEEGAYTN